MKNIRARGASALFRLSRRPGLLRSAALYTVLDTETTRKLRQLAGAQVPRDFHTLFRGAGGGGGGEGGGRKSN